MPKVVVQFGVNQLALEKRMYVAGLVTESSDPNVRVGDDVTARGKPMNTILSQCKDRCRITAECTVTENEGRQKWLATTVKIINVSPMEAIIAPTNEVLVDILTTAIEQQIRSDKTLKAQLIEEGIDPSTPGGNSAYESKISAEKKRLFDAGVEWLTDDLTNRREKTITELLKVFKKK